MTSKIPNFANMKDFELDLYDMKRCPYNRNHVVKNSRYQIHLSECLKDMNEDQRIQWRVCPFNCNHRIICDEFECHLVSCDSFNLKFESKPVINHKTEIKEEGIQLIDPKKIKEELDEKKPKIAAKIDEWSQSYDQTYEYSLENRSHLKRAEDVIESFGGKFVDNWITSGLKKSERKRLNDMRIELVKKKSIESVETVVESIDGKFSLLNEKLAQNNSLIQFWPKIETKPLYGSASGLTNEGRNPDTALNRCLISVEASEEDLMEIKLTSERLLRRPRTNPFADKVVQQLRRPQSLKSETRN